MKRIEPKIINIVEEIFVMEFMGCKTKADVESVKKDLQLALDRIYNTAIDRVEREEK